MSTKKFPIAAHFIWHPDERDVPEEIVERLQKVLFKNKTSDFSGCNEMPFFLYSTTSDSEIPNSLELKWAERNVIFIFSGIKLVISETWCSYLRDIQPSENVMVVPISLDSKGLNLPNHLSSINAIRLGDFSSNKIEYSLVCICHAIQRFLTTNKSALKIFISHCKADEYGVVLTNILQTFIKARTGLKAFFDVTEIQQGYNFENEINNNLDTSSLLVLCTDSYSSRYWCQHEVLYAKEKLKPILLVDAVRKSVDRLYPALGNVPCIRVDPYSLLPDEEKFEILTAILVETVRCNYVKALFSLYSDLNWIPKDEVVLSLRPPEAYFLSSIPKNKLKIWYPEPQVFDKEIKWLEKYGIKKIPFYGELEFSNDLKVGISISNVDKFDDYKKNHLHSRALDCFAHNMARQLVLNGIQLFYGGDFRKEGFTDAILDEIKILALDEEKKIFQNYKLKNYLAWPLYNKKSDCEEWYAENVAHLELVKVEPVGVASAQKNQFVDPNNAENKYLWSINLTAMRKKSISLSNARICAGGRLVGYKGKMPGVLEEIIIAERLEKPLFLVGAFGGVVGKVCETIFSGSISEELTEKWQTVNNDGYEELQNRAKQGGCEADYASIKSVLENLKVEILAKRCGLSEDEYRQLMQTPSVDEAIRLILLGLSHVGKQENE